MNLTEAAPDFETPADLDRPQETETRLQALLPSFQSPDSDRSHHIELLTQLARVQSLQSKFAEATLNIAEAARLLGDTEQTYRVCAKIRYLLEAGRLHVLEKTPSQARPMFFEAWTLASNSGEDYHAIDAAQMLAALDPQKLQKEWTLKALALSESSPQARAKQWQGALYTTLGWIQFDVRQFEGALEYFKKALSSAKAAGIPRKVIVAKWGVAKALRALNRLEEALDIQKDLVTELTGDNRKDGLVYEELAECLQSLKRTTEAQVYFDLAYNELSKDVWLTDNKPDRMKRMKTLGKVK